MIGGSKCNRGTTGALDHSPSVLQDAPLAAGGEGRATTGEAHVKNRGHGSKRASNALADIAGYPIGGACSRRVFSVRFKPSRGYARGRRHAIPTEFGSPRACRAEPRRARRSWRIIRNTTDDSDVVLSMVSTWHDLSLFRKPLLLQGYRSVTATQMVRSINHVTARYPCPRMQQILRSSCADFSRNGRVNRRNVYTPKTEVSTSFTAPAVIADTVFQKGSGSARRFSLPGTEALRRLLILARNDRSRIHRKTDRIFSPSFLSLTVPLFTIRDEPSVGGHSVTLTMTNRDSRTIVGAIAWRGHALVHLCATFGKRGS